MSKVISDRNIYKQPTIITKQDRYKMTKHLTPNTRLVHWLAISRYFVGQCNKTQLEIVHTKGILCLIIFAFMISCQNQQERKLNALVSKIETIGLDQFRNIEYSTRGDFEIYDYCLQKDSTVSWTYNRKSKQFEFPLIQQDSKKVAVNFPSYIQDLRIKIQSLNIVMITQSPWYGNIIGFWISDDEKIEYVNPNFKFDDRFKNEWLKEIKTSRKLKYDWYYIKIKK